MVTGDTGPALHIANSAAITATRYPYGWQRAGHAPGWLMWNGS